MSFVIGIDQSVLHTGICILNEDGSVNYLGLIEPDKLKNRDRLAYIRDELTAILDSRKFTVGVMEGYSYGSVNKKFLLGEVGSVVKLAFHDHCLRAYELAPTALKKFVTSKGSASKEDVMFAVEKQWGVVVNNDNLADAYGLARVAYEIAKPASVKRHQLDVVKLLLKEVTRTKKAPRRKAQFKDAV
jgi:crossover junction endodeoxyribonuclease RuvC